VTWSQFEDLFDKIIGVCMVLFIVMLVSFLGFLFAFGIYELLST